MLADERRWISGTALGPCVTCASILAMRATRRIRRRVACCALLAILAIPSSAAAQCGADYHGRPAHSQTAGTPPPLAIGDSVLADAVPLLVKDGFEADGMVCRQMSQGLAMLRTRAASLPTLVVLALGTNGEVTDAQIGSALAMLGPDRVLALVTPHGSVAPSSPSVIRAAAVRNPGRIVLLDWDRLVAGHPDWLAPDGVHLGGSAGIAAFAQLIASALPFAASSQAGSSGEAGASGEAGSSSSEADRPGVEAEAAGAEVGAPSDPGTPITIQPPPGHRGTPTTRPRTDATRALLPAVGAYLLELRTAVAGAW